ncbi:MAG: DUF456 domain-containing protein [Propioniciclava sp.]|uniref:DUF456 domain-containing protein n=1 Tax=Propioniciclava sp. TaxID=2038686 RepID=UPI0039E3D58E
MTPELTALLSVILAVVGVVGIVVPVLPGSLAIAGALLLWALFGAASSGWIVFGIGGVLVLAGMSAQYLITGRALKRREIPSRSVVIGVVVGLAGMVVIPFAGLALGFAVGLLGSEYVRLRDVGEAASSSWEALKSVGLGMAVELVCALAATTILVTSVLGHLLA